MQRLHRVKSQGCSYIYLVKPRQFGFTTDYAIDMLDDACFVPGASAGIVAHDRETLGKIFQIIKRGYQNMPEQLRPEIQYDTRNEYKFIRRFDGLPLDNELYVALKIRGTTVQRLHISESAHIKDRDELKMGAKQAVPIGGRISEETTGNGMNEFYDDVMEADEKQKHQDREPLTPQDYRLFFYAWFENPEYTLPGKWPGPDKAKYEDEEPLRTKYHLTDGQLLWRRWKLNEMRSKKQEASIGLNVFQRFKQEYPATLLEAFQSGAGNVFDLENVDNINDQPGMTIEDLQKWNMLTWDDLTPPEQAIRSELIKNAEALIKLGVQIWKLPEAGHRYALGGDPSDGDGADNGCLDIWDIDTLEQCAQFYGKKLPNELAQITKQMCEFFEGAFAGIENNMLTTILFLIEIYDNYFFTVTVDEKSQKKTKKVGWNTNTKTRDLMIDDFLIAFTEGSLIIHSRITKSEMKTFVKKDNGKREHADGRHDDSLFAAFIALQMKRFWKRTRRTFGEKPSGF